MSYGQLACLYCVSPLAVAQKRFEVPTGWQAAHCLSGHSDMLWAVQVRHVDPDMEFYGRGPLLSCKYMDASTLWHRAEQIAQVLEEVRPFPFTLPMHP